MMERKSLTEAVSGAAERLGYVFHTGPDALLGARVTALPAVWLSVPVLKKASGRRERRDTYAVRMCFMTAGVSGGDAAEQVRQLLEEDAAALYGMLRECGRVRTVRGLKVTSAEKPLTPLGETAVVAEFEAEMFYFD